MPMRTEIPQNAHSHYDFVVLGSGLAGLAFALKAQQLGKVAVICKTKLSEGNTSRAQGGIAAVLSHGDSLENHIEDTLTAGAGLCDKEVVQFVVSQGPERIQELVDWGVKFDLKEDQSFSLTQEGGHSQRRILHIEDHTGQELHKQLLSEALKSEKIATYMNIIK